MRIDIVDNDRQFSNNAEKATPGHNEQIEEYADFRCWEAVADSDRDINSTVVSQHEDTNLAEKVKEILDCTNYMEKCPDHRAISYRQQSDDEGYPDQQPVSYSQEDTDNGEYDNEEVGDQEYESNLEKEPKKSKRATTEEEKKLRHIEI